MLKKFAEAGFSRRLMIHTDEYMLFTDCGRVRDEDCRPSCGRDVPDVLLSVCVQKQCLSALQFSLGSQHEEYHP